MSWIHSMSSKVNLLALLLHSLLLSFVHLVPIESSHSQQHIRLIEIDKNFSDESQCCCHSWGHSCQNFPSATKVWSWHTNNHTSNALTYDTLGRFLSDTDDWLILKWLMYLAIAWKVFLNKFGLIIPKHAHLRLAKIPMQIRAGAFVGSIQKLKIYPYF